MSADAQVNLGADGSAFFKTLKSIESATDTMANSITGRLARMGQAFSAVTGGIDAVKGTIAGLGELAAKVINPAAGAEQLQLSFQVLLDGEEKALAFMEQLNAYAAQTPYSLDSISNAAKTLLAMTDLSGEQTIEVIRKLGDVCAMSGKDLTEMSRIYAKAFNSGLSNEVAESFENAGLAIRKTVADMQGITFNEVKKKISDGVLTIDHLNAALDSTVGAGGKLHGATQQLSTTFNGLASTLGDNVNQALTRMGQELLPSIKPAMEKLIEAVQAAFPIFEQLGESMGAWLGDRVEDTVLPALEDMMMFLPEVADAFELISTKVGEFADMITGLRGPIGTAQEWLADLTATMSIYLANEAATWQEAKRLQQEFKDTLTEADDPAAQIERRAAARRAEFEAMMAQSKTRADVRRKEAQARDAAREAEREAAAAAKKEQDRKRRAAMEAAEQSAAAVKSAEKEAEARKKVTEEEEKYQRQLMYRRMAKQSLDEQEKNMMQTASTLGVQGPVSTKNISARIGELNAKGGYAKEIKALQELRTEWDKLIERKKAYNRTRLSEEGRMKADYLELRGNQRGADKLREEVTIRERINELTEQGMEKEKARQQAMAESKIRQLQEARQNNPGVLEIKQSRVSVGGGGTYLRVDYQREAMKRSNDLLSEIRNLLQKGLKIDLSGKLPTTATLG